MRWDGKRWELVKIPETPNGGEEEGVNGCLTAKKVRERKRILRRKPIRNKPAIFIPTMRGPWSRGEKWKLYITAMPGGWWWRIYKLIYFVWFLKKVIKSFLSFSFFKPPNAILVPGMYFFGFSRYSNKDFSFQTTPFCLFASVYWNPATCPDWRPKRPKRLGPTLLAPSFSRVWHCRHRVLKRFAPLASSPSAKGIVY